MHKVLISVKWTILSLCDKIVRTSINVIIHLYYLYRLKEKI
jgi:hypothetical protein